VAKYLNDRSAVNYSVPNITTNTFYIMHLIMLDCVAVYDIDFLLKLLSECRK
jgi:hypothetical protein